MIDRELLEKKKKLQKVRNILKTLDGIKVLCIYETPDSALEQILENLSDIGYYAYTKQPDSRISVKADDSLIYQWIAENMHLGNRDILFLLCKGIWVKIQIIETMTAMQSLWNQIDPCCKGFTVLNEAMDTLSEVGNDSRDELNYLFDVYSINID